MTACRRTASQLKKARTPSSPPIPVTPRPSSNTTRPYHPVHRHIDSDRLNAALDTDLFVDASRRCTSIACVASPRPRRQGGLEPTGIGSRRREPHDLRRPTRSSCLRNEPTAHPSSRPSPRGCGDAPNGKSNLRSIRLFNGAHAASVVRQPLISAPADLSMSACRVALYCLAYG